MDPANADGPHSASAPHPITTYSLAEVSAMVLPPKWKDPELWLMRRLRTREISGYKVGHEWRMTGKQVEALVEQYTNTAQHGPAIKDGVVAGLTQRGARRLRGQR